MSKQEWVIEPFDFYAAGDEAYEAVHAFSQQVRAERYPDDDPVPFDEYLDRNRNIPGDTAVQSVIARLPNGTVIGQATTWVLPDGKNLHLLCIEIDVLAGHRRKGLGAQLLRFVAEDAQRRDRSLLLGVTYSTVPAGEAFARRIGAHLGQEARINQLVLADVDWDLVQAWRQQEQTEAAFELRFNQGFYPEDLLPGMVSLINLVNRDEPRDDLDLEHVQVTPESIREREQWHFAAGEQRWTLCAMARESGDFAGYTEIYWHPNRPAIVQQGGTGVFPRYRGRGLGRWLKAAMLNRIRTELPDVQFIRTGNANSNLPMLRINNQLGFRPYIDEMAWQLSVADALHDGEQSA